MFCYWYIYILTFVLDIKRFYIYTYIKHHVSYIWYVLYDIYIYISYMIYKYKYMMWFIWYRRYTYYIYIIRSIYDIQIYEIYTCDAYISIYSNNNKDKVSSNLVKKSSR